jgi:1-acyl-sn-glycerol-3-phosphate acyltransferase
MDAEALERYSFFKRLGFFGIERGTPSGTRRFLKVTRSVVANPGTVLWITPQGRFADPRERPVRLAPGIAHLAYRMDRGVIVPLALEYPFWKERLPEVLVRFGEPISMGSSIEVSSVQNWHEVIETRLTEVQDQLAAEAVQRNEQAFESLCMGKEDIGGIKGLRDWF